MRGDMRGLIASKTVRITYTSGRTVRVADVAFWYRDPGGSDYIFECMKGPRLSFPIYVAVHGKIEAIDIIEVVVHA